MSYKVIHYFTDLQDNNHPYRVGDIFPRSGMNVTETRLKELSSANNRQGKPLIELVEDTAKEVEVKETVKPETEVQYTKTEINRMPVEQLRKIAKKAGAKSTDDMTGKELKEYLIDVFNL